MLGGTGTVTNQRLVAGVDGLVEVVVVREVAPEHLVFARGGDPRGRFPHHRLPVDAPAALRVLRHLLQRRQDRPRRVPAEGRRIASRRGEIKP